MFSNNVKLLLSSQYKKFKMLGYMVHSVFTFLFMFVSHKRKRSLLIFFNPHFKKLQFRGTLGGSVS